MAWQSRLGMVAQHSALGDLDRKHPALRHDPCDDATLLLIRGVLVEKRMYYLHTETI
jgi:hypothetical protein